MNPTSKYKIQNHETPKRQEKLTKTVDMVMTFWHQRHNPLRK